MKKLLLINPFVMFHKSNFICLFFIFIFSFRVKMIWNIGDDKIHFLKLKSKLGLYHVVLTTPNFSLEKLTLTVVEMQQLPDIDKTDFKNIYLAENGQCIMVGEKYV